MKSREAEDKPTVLKSDPKVSKWIFICEEETRIDLDKFEKFIQQYDPAKGEPINDDDLFIAVKTCEQFHTERVPVVLDTWAKESKNIEFYSETVDDSIPTIDLGVPNTERERLKRLLACYDPTGLIAIGERYGYRSALGDGYDYITGGGGMPMVEKLVEGCKCPQDDSPDDMIIGMCLKRFNIPITHVPYLHQARPDDYSEGYLSRQIPVSFHKHWNNDPRAVYRLLKSYDKQEQEGSVQTDKHTEL
ncbi:B3GLT-like protein [Mya arenaria]|uniref:B3GLT-like protein n=1 Tax=Mya arenaria TaxID=6604 RepID=A0ABY7DW36_MYAAR|nr:B3GLT-like protein [Mya arenaria]